jgi:ABC-type multidrug transport system fused ATPase/permease subunit
MGRQLNGWMQNLSTLTANRSSFFFFGGVVASVGLYSTMWYISERVYWAILFVIPYLFIGILIIMSPFIEYRRRSVTMYVITNMRVIAMVGCRSSMSIKSYDADKLEDIHWKDNGDGLGDVVFAKEWQNNNENERTIDVGFFNIRNAEEVEGMIKKLSSGTLHGLELPTATTDVDVSSTSTLQGIVLPTTTDVDENDIIVSPAIP